MNSDTFELCDECKKDPPKNTYTKQNNMCIHKFIQMKKKSKRMLQNIIYENATNATIIRNNFAYI